MLKSQHICIYLFNIYCTSVCIYICVYIFVQSLSYIRLSVTSWTVACQASPYFTISQVCSNSCPLSQWCQATVSSSVAPFSSCPQSSTASGSFSKGRFLLRRWPKYQSFSFSISPFNAYSGWCPLGVAGLSSLQSKGLSKTLPQYHSSKTSILRRSLSFWPKSHPYMTTGKTIALTRWTFVGNMVSLLFNTLSRFLI